jgi:hypothetical protein
VVKRPKTTQAQRDERRAEARRSARERKFWEREIALGKVKLVSWEEWCRRYLYDDDWDFDPYVFIEVPMRPDLRFMQSRLRHLPVHQQLNGVAYKQALIDLMASDTPMSVRERARWTTELARVKKSRLDRPRATPLWAKAFWYNDVIDTLVEDGYTVEEAKAKIVQDHKLASVEALNQMLRRAARQHEKKSRPAKSVG